MGFSTNQPSDYIAVGFQSAKDTEATTFFFAKHLDGSGMEIDENVVTERVGGGGQEAGLRYKSLIKEDGQLNTKGDSEFLHVGFAGVLGDTATSINAGSGIASSLATGLQIKRLVPSPTLPYITVEQRWSDELERTSNCKVTTLDITGEAGKPAELNFTFISGGTPYRRPIASALTPSRETPDPVYFPRGSYSIDGAGNTKITKFKVSAKRNVDDGIQTTELFREDVIELNADYDLDFTLKYEDATFWRKIKYGAGSMVPIALATGAFKAYMANTGAGTMFRSVDIHMPLIQYVGAKVNKLDPDGKTVYLDVSAMTLGGAAGATTSLFADVVVASRADLV